MLIGILLSASLFLITSLMLTYNHSDNIITLNCPITNDPNEASAMNAFSSDNITIIPNSRRPLSPNTNNSWSLVPVADSFFADSPDDIIDEPIFDDQLYGDFEDGYGSEFWTDGGQQGGGSGSGEGEADLPGINDFTYAEILPELVYSIVPEYPRILKEAGFEGKVILKVLVSKDGGVLEARVLMSSGREAFDKSALKVAYKYRYRPALQNNRPLAIWVSYSVEFKLD